MLLENKNAIIYGAGGGIGGGIARTFAGEGARVFLAGRTRASLEAVAADITAAGGSAEVAELDALDEHAVDEHAQAVASRVGSIDVSFNLVSRGRAGDTAGRHDDSRLRPSHHHRDYGELHHRAGGGAPHDRAGIRRHPRVGQWFR